MSMKTIGQFLKAAEPWGVALTVIGLEFTAWQFSVERADREEDRVNRAIGQFADGIGRSDALSVLRRNNVDLRYMRARDAFLPQTDLKNMNLNGIDFSGAILSGANFRGATLNRASFAGAILDGANFTGANLTGSDFTGASVGLTTFANAKLIKTKFIGAVFDTNVDRTAADPFLGAEFMDTDFTGARFSNQIVWPGFFDWTVSGDVPYEFYSSTMPDGTQCTFHSYQVLDALFCPYLKNYALVPTEITR